MNALAALPTRAWAPPAIDGEVLAPADDRATIRVIACPDPFSIARIERQARAGESLAEIVAATLGGRQTRRHAHVFIDDLRIDQKLWRRVRPKPGATVIIRVVPGRGGGGGGGKNVLSIVLSVVAVAATFILGPHVGALLAGAAGFGGAGATILGLSAATVFAAAGRAIVGIAAMLIVNALAPPPRPRLDSLAGRGAFSVTGTQNRANPYGPIPRVYGKRRVFAELGASAYTEVVGKDQYLRLLFDFGYGPLNLSDHRIGTTPINQFENVEMEIRQGYPDDAPITLYTNQIVEDQYSIKITKAGPPQIIETRDAADEITIDIGFPGLIWHAGNNDNRAVPVEFIVEYRAAGTAGAWLPFDGLTGHTITSAMTDQFHRHSIRIKPATPGRYELRFTRVTIDYPDGGTVRAESYLSVVRTIRYAPPTNVTGHCLVAIRIKASEQLNGVVQTYNVIAEALLPQWDGAAFGAPALTRDPAWASLDVLRGAANKRPIPDARIDLASFKALADRNAVLDQNGEPRYLFDAVFDARTTVLEAVNDILATCRAALAMRDGKWSVIIDKPQTVPVQMFTPRNSWGFKSSKTFVERPHALRCRIINPTREWSEDEVTVYADGYSKANATLFETMDFFGVVRASQAWREGRYHQAVAKLRPEKYELSADIEHLVCSRGDLVRVAHDVPRWGLGYGRIKSLTTGGGGVITSLTLDERVTLEAGKAYAVRVRGADGALAYATVVGVSAAIETATLQLSPSLAAGACDVGDLAVFGEAARESVELLVKSIKRMGDFTARIELVDAAPAVHQSDIGVIPPFDTQSTWPGQGVNLAPPRPAIDEVRSDEDALLAQPGSGWITAIRLTLGARSGVLAPIERLEVQLRPTGSAEAWRSVPFPGAPNAVFVTGVVERIAYDLRARYISNAGIASDWTTVDAHFVIGRSTPPPAALAVRVERGALVVDYPPLPRDFLGWKIEYHRGVNRLRGGAIPAHPTPVAAFPFDLSNFPGGTLTIFVVAVDTSGNESEPAILVRDFDGPETDNIVQTIDIDALGFPGTIVNGTVTAGELRADAEPDVYLPGDDAVYLPIGTDLYLPVQWRALEWITSFAPDQATLPATLSMRTTVDAETWRLEYKGDDGALYLSDGGALYLPAGGDPYLPSTAEWAVFPGAIDASPILYQFKTTAPASAKRAVVSQFHAVFDVPDEAEEFDDLIVPSTGLRLPIAGSYRDIITVQATLQHDGGGADSVRVIDKDRLLGPLVQTYKAGVAFQGTIDATVRGIRQ